MYKFIENSYKNWPKSGSFIMWMLGEKEEKNPDIVHEQAKDIADKKFAGVLIVPRAGTLDIREPDAINLFQETVKAAKSVNLNPWLMADPRLASDSLIKDTGEALEIVIPVIIKPGETQLPPAPPIRPTHMHQGGAIMYEFLRYERAYDLKFDSENILTGRDEIHDPEAWISASERQNKGLLFPLYRTNFFDYSNPCMWAFWEEYISTIFSRIDGLTGMCWDEVGFFCDGDRFPFTKYIEGEFLRKFGYDLSENLLYLAVDTPDRRHIKVRNNYFSLLNSILADSMDKNFRLIEKYSENINNFTIGIHATWHGEFCGIEERNHGAMDLWKLRPYQTAAFTDIGEVEKLVEPSKGPDVLYSLVLMRSLSRVGPNQGLLYSNLWGINFGGEGDPAPVEVIDYWSDLIDLFGAGWIAHGYGWPGTRFTDLHFGPGYPDHPTWERFREVNSEIIKRDKSRERGEDVTDVLVVFPLESFYAVGQENYREETWGFVRLIDSLTRSGFQVDVISSTWLKDAVINDGAISLNDRFYHSLIVPHCTVIADPVYDLIKAALDAEIPVFAGTGSDGPMFTSGIPAPIPPEVFRYDFHGDPMSIIKKNLDPTFILPDGALANVFLTPSGCRIHIIPDRPFGKFSGIFMFDEYQLKINERTEPFVIDLPYD